MELTGSRNGPSPLALIAALAPLIATPTPALGEPNADKGPVEQTRLLAAESAEVARRASISRETMFLAAGNAVALQEKCLRTVLAALKDGRKEQIRTARETLQRTTAECTEAVALGEETVALVAAIERFAAAARSAAGEASQAKTDRDRKAALKSAKEHNREAADASRKLAELVDSMKKKWLIPDIGKTPGGGERAASSGRPAP